MLSTYHGDELLQGDEAGAVLEDLALQGGPGGQTLRVCPWPLVAVQGEEEVFGGDAAGPFRVELEKEVMKSLAT